MNIFIHRKSKIKKFLVFFYAVFVIFSSVFMKYSVNVYAASNDDSPVGDYITNSIGDSNFARMVLYRDMAHGYSVNTHDLDYQNFLDGYSSGIGVRFQRYCVEELGFNEDDVKKLTQIIKNSIDTSGGGGSHSFGTPYIDIPSMASNGTLFGTLYTYDKLIEGFCKWDADNFKLENKKTKDFENLSGDNLYDIACVFLNGLPIYIKNKIKTITDTKVQKFDFSKENTGKLLKIVCNFVSDTEAFSNYGIHLDYWRNKNTHEILKASLDFCFQNGTVYVRDFDFNTHEYVLYWNRDVKLGDVNTDDVKNYNTVYASQTAINNAGIQNNTNVTNNCLIKNETINNIFNTENYHEGDTLINTDNLYGDEFSLNYNRIDGLNYIPIKVDTSNLTDEEKENCPCEIVSLPQGDFLMLPITQDGYHMPDLNILTQLTNNNYCTQQDFINQFTRIMNYTVINKDGDVYNFNGDTVTINQYETEINNYNKENYIPNGTSITKIFPFCLPFDISKLISPFNAEPVTPKFVVNFSTFNSNIKFNDASSDSGYASSGSTGGGSMDIDFDKLKIDELAKLLRSGEIILFTISLAIWFFKVVSK